MGDSSDATTPIISSPAEDLRLEGNAAFASKKWKLAVTKYQESIKIDGTSKKSGELLVKIVWALHGVWKFLLCHGIIRIVSAM